MHNINYTMGTTLGENVQEALPQKIAYSISLDLDYNHSDKALQVDSKLMQRLKFNDLLNDPS